MIKVQRNAITSLYTRIRHGAQSRAHEQKGIVQVSHRYTQIQAGRDERYILRSLRQCRVDLFDLGEGEHDFAAVVGAFRLLTGVSLEVDRL